jgi:hypothetical protein
MYKLLNCFVSEWEWRSASTGNGDIEREQRRYVIFHDNIRLIILTSSEMKSSEMKSSEIEGDGVK